MKKSIAMLTVLIGLASFAPGAELAGVELPESHGDLKLYGAGLLRKALFFKIYVGALYVADTRHADRIMDEVPKRIDIHYFHNTPKRYMIDAAEETLRRNLSAADYEKIKPEIDQLHAAYRDGKAGSTASILFRPNEGLSYAFDGEPIITIEDDDFANAYFSIWLGRNPSSQSVKEGMLTPIEREKE